MAEGFGRAGSAHRSSSQRQGNGARTSKRRCREDAVPVARQKLAEDRFADAPAPCQRYRARHKAPDCHHLSGCFRTAVGRYARLKPDRRCGLQETLPSDKCCPVGARAATPENVAARHARIIPTRTASGPSPTDRRCANRHGPCSSTPGMPSSAAASRRLFACRSRRKGSRE